MKNFILAAVFAFLNLTAQADPFQIQRDGQNYYCTADQGNVAPQGLCVQESLSRTGAIDSACERVKNLAQDQCANLTLGLKGFVDPDCLQLQAGIQCATTSLSTSNSIDAQCLKITSYQQDICAQLTLKRKGVVDSTCLNLN
jgi:hypothetical protein